VVRVLLVEDDQRLRQAVTADLERRGHVVQAVASALEALRAVAQQVPDLVILDLGLPDLDGAQALQMIRGVSMVPVLVATARDDEREVISVLNAGADDYLIKPFSPEHLDARISGLLRRVKDENRDDVLVLGGLTLKRLSRQVALDGAQVDLTRREFDLLAYLMSRPGEVVTRQELLQHVWQNPDGDEKIIDAQLSWLRRKLGDQAAQPRYLHTVRGVGVKLDAPTAAAPPA
jgi:DNA-binding response OmpR family regulator